ncbi:MAG TPA: type IV secretion system protein [Propylenella sp.]|nr:type IV secretion system protein [Propylenella sp.]
MACPPIATGSGFLVTTLSHLDCQGQTLGSFGFQSLASPGSPAAAALTALLTLFIAVYGIRLLFGPVDEPRGLINAVLKIGIVLTIAISWPAWRTVAYDLVNYGPPQLAASIMPATMPEARATLPQRLQQVDAGIAALTFAGTGRQVGEVINEGVASRFRSVALADETAFGWSRPMFLASVIGSLGLLRLTGGLLLAMAPLLAGLLLFDLSRGIFMGWLRGLIFVALGSLALTVVLSLQLAIMEPWLADALNRRNLGYATPTAPTELLSMVLAFTLAIVGTLFLMARVAFHNSWAFPVFRQAKSEPSATSPGVVQAPQRQDRNFVHSRALAIGENVTHSMRREVSNDGHMRRIETIGRSGPPPQTNTPSTVAEPLGNRYSRDARRVTRSQLKRDEQQ